MTTVSASTCSSCGSPVAIVPIELTGKFAEIAARLEPLCDTCSARMDAEAEQHRADQRDRENDRQQAERIKRSGLPGRHHHELASLGLPVDVKASADRWVSHGGGLLLSGPVGVGKTTIAGAACFERLRLRHCHLVSAPLLFARLGSGFGTDQHDQAISLLTGKTALALDDVDKARPTEYGAERIFNAVDQRVEHESPLLVTTNLTPGELASRFPEPYGDAIASRLVGYCDTVEITGVDRRLEAR